MTAALWLADTPPPNLCAHCADEHAPGPHDQEFFIATVDGVDVGPLSCDCLCDDVNWEVAS